MKIIKRKTGLIILVAMACSVTALCGVSFAETQVHESGKAAADGLVVVENIAGSIEIIGWDKKEVKVEGTLSDEVEGLDFEVSGNKTTISVEYPRNIRNIEAGADLIIYLPEKSSLDMESISCSIDIRDFFGNVSVETISGDVTLAGDCDEVEISCISGNILVEGDCPVLDLESISGRIYARGQKSSVSASSITGRIELTFDTFTVLEIESVDSTVLVDGSLADGGKIEIESVSGDINLVLPKNTSAKFEIETFSGSIAKAFGHKASKVSKYAPGKEMEFVAGDGDGRVEISTFSGDVKITH